MERDILVELATAAPVADLGGFRNAHRLALQALEVLDRNGPRAPALRRLGRLEPIGVFLVSVATRYIVRAHQSTLTRRMRRLYERREALAETGTEAHRALRRARLDVTLVETGYRSGSFRLPAFLLGGAILSTVASTLQGAAAAVFETPLGPGPWPRPDGGFGPAAF